MSDVYPRAESVIEIKSLDKLDVASSIIECIGFGLTKKQMIGKVLNGSNDVYTFNAVYSEVLAEGKKLRKVSLYKPDSEKELRTESGYKKALSAQTVYLDSDLWYAGLKDELGVSSWAALKEKLISEDI